MAAKSKTTDQRLFKNVIKVKGRSNKNKPEKTEVKVDSSSESEEDPMGEYEDMMKMAQEIDEQQKKEMSELRDAIKRNSVAKVKEILENDTWLLRRKFSVKMTPLQYANHYGHTDVAKEIEKHLTENK